MKGWKSVRQRLTEYNPLMLDVRLEQLAYRPPRSGFQLSVDHCLFERGTQTALVGAAGAGKSTLLRLISGALRPDRGSVWVGSRDITPLKPSRRPILSSDDEITPGRWSAAHTLIAALRKTTLDQEDRRQEFDLVVDRWSLGPFLERPVRSLSSTERLRVRLAQIECLRPAILLAERLLQDAAAADASQLTDLFYRTMRTLGTTLVTEISRTAEVGMCNAVVIMDRGSIVQIGNPKDVYDKPVNHVAAAATGTVNAIPVVVQGTCVESIIGEWSADPPPFQGEGIALLRPAAFALTRPGEDSDFILAVEEAHFAEGAWEVRGFLTGALSLRVRLSGSEPLHKGKLLPLRIREGAAVLSKEPHRQVTGIPTDVIPPLQGGR